MKIDFFANIDGRKDKGKDGNWLRLFHFFDFWLYRTHDKWNDSLQIGITIFGIDFGIEFIWNINSNEDVLNLESKNKNQPESIEGKYGFTCDIPEAGINKHGS